MAKHICTLEGVRGRGMILYDTKCVFTTKVTAGSIITKNATDGDKTIFLCDVTGVQFKKYKMKKHIVLDRKFILFIITGAFMLFLSYFCFSGGERDTALGVAFALFGVFFIAVPAVLHPFCYVFDRDSVSICFLFLPKERYLWKNVYSIDAEYDAGAHRNPFMDYFFSRVFAVNGDVEGKERFYMKGNIIRTKRTKKLIEKYWDGTVEGYFSDTVKAWWSKKKEKKEKEQSAHLTDSISAMEREVRRDAKAIIDPYTARAAQYGLCIYCKYLCIDRDYNVTSSRPDRSYTYTAELTVCPEGERNEEKQICVCVELIRVRLGKREYIGKILPDAALTLTGVLDTVFEEIEKNGFEKAVENI